MAESRKNYTTHIVEILPYMYNCRNWYETAAEVAGLNYHKVVNKKPPANVTDPELIGCWSDASLCATILCHDKLRDQFTVVEPDTLREIWVKIAEDLKYTVVPE
jgi:hypothetical protein